MLFRSIRLDDTTVLENQRSNSFKKEISQFEKARKEKKEAISVERFEEISELSNNDRVHFIGYLVGGIGMKRPQRNGDYFKILLTNNKSESMPVVYIFNHDDIHKVLSQNISALFKFENFRVSVHHGIKGIVSTDNVCVQKLSGTSLSDTATLSNPRSVEVSSSSSSHVDQTVSEEIGRAHV